MHVNVCHSNSFSDKELNYFVELQINNSYGRNEQLQLEQSSPIPTGCFFANLGYHDTFDENYVRMYSKRYPSLRTSLIIENTLQNISSTEFAECHIFASYRPANERFKQTITISKQIASDLQDVMGNDEEWKKLNEYLCILEKQAHSPKSPEKLLELQFSNFLEVTGSHNSTFMCFWDLTQQLNKLDLYLLDNSTSKENKGFRSLNETFRELRKLNDIYENLDLKTVGLRPSIQEIVPALQDCRDILNKITKNLEKTEIEEVFKSELEESQHSPEMESLLEETIKCFVAALAEVRYIFNLHISRIQISIESKKDQYRETQLTEEDFKNVMSSLVILVHRAEMKQCDELPLLELTKLPLLEMIIKVLGRWPPSQRPFYRIQSQLGKLDSHDTIKLHEELYKELREELSEEEKQNYPELTPTENTEEHKTPKFRISKLQEIIFEKSQELVAMIPSFGFDHPPYTKNNEDNHTLDLLWLESVTTRLVESVELTAENSTFGFDHPLSTKNKEENNALDLRRLKSIKTILIESVKLTAMSSFFGFDYPPNMKNSEENNALDLHRLESTMTILMESVDLMEMNSSFGYTHPLHRLLSLLQNFSFDPKEPYSMMNERNCMRSFIASGVLCSESMRKCSILSEKGGTLDSLKLINSFSPFGETNTTLNMPQRLKDLYARHRDKNFHQNVSAAIVASKQILYNAISRTRVMCRIHIFVLEGTKKNDIDDTLKKIFPEARIKHFEATNRR